MNIITEEIINYVKQIHKNLDNWYAGITNDLVRRKEEHERKKNIKCEYLKGWTCKSEDEARSIEKELEQNGIPTHRKDIEIIASQKTEPSTIVYVFLAVSKDTQHFIRLLKNKEEELK